MNVYIYKYKYDGNDDCKQTKTKKNTTILSDKVFATNEVVCILLWEMNGES